MTTFGTQVKQLRTGRGLTQDALAELVGCATQTVRKIEAGDRRPSYQMAWRFAQVFGLDADERTEFIELARVASGPLDLASEAPAPVTPTHELPIYLTTFIGREQEQERLLQMLAADSCRLITIVGLGGIGKTRLAIAAAERSTGFADGIGFVALAAISDPHALAETIATALGLNYAGAADLTGQLIDQLSGKQLLLILDNLEQLIDPEGVTIDLVQQILQKAPHVKILVTSRERLRMQGEWVVELGGLPVPPDSRAESLHNSPAIRLFLERARRVQHSFRLLPGDAEMLVTICRIIEGMPLGLELAAAWLPVLSLQEIGQELARGLDAEPGPMRDWPARHASLHAVFDSSWQLLSDTERQALRRLAIFHGGCTREAAAEAAGASLTTLAALVDKSLLRRTQAGRYELHEAIRQFALAKLQEAPLDQQAAYSRHSAYYAALLQRSITAQTGGTSSDAWAKLMQDIENVRIAWSRAARIGDSATVLAMARGMMLLYDASGWVLEGAALFRRAADALRSAGVRADTAIGTMLGFAGYFLQLRQPAAGAPLLEEAVQLLEQAGETGGQAQFLLHLGTGRIAAACFESARDRYELASRLAEANDDPLTRLWATFFLGVLALYTGNRPAAAEYFTASLDAWRGQGFQRGIASSLTWLSEVARQDGRLGEAAALAREGLQIGSIAHDQPAIGRALRELGALALERGDLDEAAYFLSESCATFDTIGRPWVYGRSRTLLLRLEVLQGRYDAARQGCTELLRIVRDGAAIMLPEAAHGAALLLDAVGKQPEALAILYALRGVPGEYVTLIAAAQLQHTLEQRLAPDQRTAAEEQARQIQLLSWLETLL